MLKFIGVCAALMAMFVTGESLTCHSCWANIAGKCLYGTTETCLPTENNCFTGKLTLHLSDCITTQKQGCVTTALCNKTETGSLLNAGYTFERTCCSTDLCNGAASIRLPLGATLGTALMALWSSLSI